MTFLTITSYKVINNIFKDKRRKEKKNKIIEIRNKNIP